MSEPTIERFSRQDENQAQLIYSIINAVELNCIGKSIDEAPQIMVAWYDHNGQPDYLSCMGYPTSNRYTIAEDIQQKLINAGATEYAIVSLDRECRSDEQGNKYYPDGENRTLTAIADSRDGAHLFMMFKVFVVKKTRNIKRITKIQGMQCPSDHPYRGLLSDLLATSITH